MGLVLDTSIPIAGERRRQSFRTLIERINGVFGDVELVISAVTVIEFTHGIYRAKTAYDMQQRRLYSDELINTVRIEPVTLEVALLAGRIQGEETARGNIIDFEDLVIGSTALHLGFDVLTLNLKHFKMIPGLTVHTL